MDKEEILSRCRVEYSVYPNFDHPEYKSNSCDGDYSGCEGDCPECPNKEFFKRADEALALIGRRGHAQLLRLAADRMDAIADKHGDEIKRQ